jgi:branched-subunit amino acid permease
MHLKGIEIGNFIGDFTVNSQKEVSVMPEWLIAIIVFVGLFTVVGLVIVMFEFFSRMMQIKENEKHIEALMNYFGLYFEGVEKITCIDDE